MLGTEHRGPPNDVNTRHVSGEKIEGTYTPKMAIPRSDDRSFVWKIKFSGLFTSRVSDPKTSLKLWR